MIPIRPVLTSPDAFLLSLQDKKKKGESDTMAIREKTKKEKTRYARHSQRHDFCARPPASSPTISPLFSSALLSSTQQQPPLPLLRPSVHSPMRFVQCYTYRQVNRLRSSCPDLCRCGKNGKEAGRGALLVDVGMGSVGSVRRRAPTAAARIIRPVRRRSVHGSS